MIVHHVCELLKGRLLLDSSDAAEGLTHNSNEHVHEHELDQDGCKYEEEPHGFGVEFRVVVHAELAKTCQVRMDQGIERPKAQMFLIDGTVGTSCAVHVDHSEHIREGGQAEQQHDGEDLDVLCDLGEHTDERRERLEQSHPVEQLEVKHEHGKSTQNVQGVFLHGSGELADHIGGAQADREEVEKVPEVSEVAFGVSSELNHFQEEEGHEGLAPDNECNQLADEREAIVVGVRSVRKVGGVQDERREVEDEGNEQRVEDRVEVTLPHEVNEDTHLVAREHFIVVSLSKDVNESGRVVSIENPVEVKNFGFNLLQPRVFLFLDRNDLDT